MLQKTSHARSLGLSNSEAMQVVPRVLWRARLPPLPSSDDSLLLQRVVGDILLVVQERDTT